MFIRYNITAGTWDASREAEAREACEWDILDSTLKHWHICCRSCVSGSEIISLFSKSSLPHPPTSRFCFIITQQKLFNQNLTHFSQRIGAFRIETSIYD